MDTLFFEQKKFWQIAGFFKKIIKGKETTEKNKKTETTPMDIKVLGSGCPTCKKLFNLVSRVAKEVGITESITYVPDIKEVLKLKVLKTPVVTIRGKVVMTGFEIEPEEIKKEKIKKILLDNQ